MTQLPSGEARLPSRAPPLAVPGAVQPLPSCPVIIPRPTALDTARGFADTHRPIPPRAPRDEGREPTAGLDRRGRPDRAGPRPVAGEGRGAVPPGRQDPRPRAGVPRDGRPGP